MKNLIILALMLTSLVSFGQYSRHSKNTHLDKGFESKISIGYGFGKAQHDDYSHNRLKVNVLASYRFGPHFSTGIGTGLIMYTSGKYVNLNLVPIYLNLQANFSKTKVSPYIGTDVGFSLGKVLKDNLHNVGFYFNPGLGINIKLSKSTAMDIGVSYETQYMRVHDWETNYKDLRLSAFIFSVGLIF